MDFLLSLEDELAREAAYAMCNCPQEEIRNTSYTYCPYLEDSLLEAACILLEVVVLSGGDFDYDSRFRAALYMYQFSNKQNDAEFRTDHSTCLMIGKLAEIDYIFADLIITARPLLQIHTSDEAYAVASVMSCVVAHPIIVYAAIPPNADSTGLCVGGDIVGQDVNLSRLAAVLQMSDMEADAYVTATTSGDTKNIDRLERSCLLTSSSSSALPNLLTAAKRRHFRMQVMRSSGSSMCVKIWNIPSFVRDQLIDEMQQSPHAISVLAYIWNHAEAPTNARFSDNMVVISADKTPYDLPLGTLNVLVRSPSLTASSYITVWSLPKDSLSNRRIATCITDYLTVLRCEVFGDRGRHRVMFTSCTGLYLPTMYVDRNEGNAEASTWADRVGPVYEFRTNGALKYGANTRMLEPTTDKGYLVINMLDCNQFTSYTTEVSRFLGQFYRSSQLVASFRI